MISPGLALSTNSATIVFMQACLGSPPGPGGPYRGASECVVFPYENEDVWQCGIKRVKFVVCDENVLDK